jgi:hypothetical protein
MLKKVIFAAALALGFVTSFHVAKGQVIPNRVEITKASACRCDPNVYACCMTDTSCCGS